MNVRHHWPIFLVLVSSVSQKTKQHDDGHIRVLSCTLCVANVMEYLITNLQ